MSPAEKALAAKNPTFADLCEAVRQTRRAQLRAKAATAAARARLDEVIKAERDAENASCHAMEAMDEFIDRECALDGDA